MIETLTKWDVYLGLAINSVFTGIGAGIGTWVATHGLIDTFRKLKKRLKKRVKNGPRRNNKVVDKK